MNGVIDRPIIDTPWTVSACSSRVLSPLRTVGTHLVLSRVHGGKPFAFARGGYVSSHFGSEQRCDQQRRRVEIYITNSVSSVAGRQTPREESREVAQKRKEGKHRRMKFDSVRWWRTRRSVPKATEVRFTQCGSPFCPDESPYLSQLAPLFSGK